MNTAVATIQERQPRSVLVDMATRYGMEPAAFEATVRATVCKGNVSREEFAAFLLVAKEYRLNPLTKEIYAFPAKGGGIQPIVSIDGWARIINERSELDGIEFDDQIVEGELFSVTARIWRKDRRLPIVVTEYMSECRRSTDVWKQWPARMLRHKALIQCARYAFGFSGIVDPDEYERQMAGALPAPQPRRLHADFEDTMPEPPRELDAALEASFEDVSPPAATQDQRQDTPPPVIEGVGPASQVLTTVKARKEAFEAWAAKTSAAGLKSARSEAKFGALCKDIDAGDPDEVGTGELLRAWLDDLIEEAERAERKAVAKGGA